MANSVNWQFLLLLLATWSYASSLVSSPLALSGDDEESRELILPSNTSVVIDYSDKEDEPAERVIISDKKREPILKYVIVSGEESEPVREVIELDEESEPDASKPSLSRRTLSTVHKIPMVQKRFLGATLEDDSINDFSSSSKEVSEGPEDESRHDSIEDSSMGQMHVFVKRTRSVPSCLNQSDPITDFSSDLGGAQNGSEPSNDGSFWLEVPKVERQSGETITQGDAVDKPNYFEDYDDLFWQEVCEVEGATEKAKHVLLVDSDDDRKPRASDQGGVGGSGDDGDDVDDDGSEEEEYDANGRYRGSPLTQRTFNEGHIEAIFPSLPYKSLNRTASAESITPPKANREAFMLGTDVSPILKNLPVALKAKTRKETAKKAS